MMIKREVLEIQKRWADAVVALGTLKADMKACRQAAHRLIPALYAVKEKEILFKPTLAAEFQFRHTEEEVISYFLGNDKRFKEDNGFALRPWVDIRFENAGMILEPKRALVMGNYFFTALDGDVVKAEFTFGYIRLDSGVIKIDLHHSSLPYDPK